MTRRMWKKIARRGTVGLYDGLLWAAARDFCDKHPKWEVSDLSLRRFHSSYYGTAAYPRPFGRPNPRRRRTKK